MTPVEAPELRVVGHLPADVHRRVVPRVNASGQAIEPDSRICAALGGIFFGHAGDRAVRVAERTRGVKRGTAVG